MNRYNGYDILDEYVDITNKIREIQGIINRYRDTTRLRLELTNSESKKQIIIDKFQKKMCEVRQSDLITSTYTKLKRRQTEIRAILLPNDFESGDSGSGDSGSGDSESEDSESNCETDSDSENISHIKNYREDILSLLEDIKNHITE